MRLFAWDEATRSRHYSALSIVESVCASATSFAVAHYWGYWLHILVASALAPLVLIRTRQSQRLGLQRFVKHSLGARRWYRRNQTRVVGGAFLGWLLLLAFAGIGLYFRSVPVFLALIVVVWLPIAYFLRVFAIIALAIRIRTAMTVLLLRPGASISAIPTNWARITFAVDLSCPPEVISGAEQHNEAKPFRASEFFRAFLLPHRNRLVTRLDYISMVMSTGLFYVTAYLYRFSLKATFPVYLPLLWLIRSPTRDKDPIVAIKLTRTVRFEAWKRIYAAFVLSAEGMVFGYVLLYGYLQTSEEANWLLRYYVPVSDIGVWHITRAIAAILTFAIYFVADEAKGRIELHALGNADIWWRLIIAMKRGRGVCSLITLGFGLSMLASLVDLCHLPTIRFLP